MRHSHARRYIEIKLVISVAVHLLQRRRKNWAAACFYSPSQKHFLPVYLDVLYPADQRPFHPLSGESSEIRAERDRRKIPSWSKARVCWTNQRILENNVTVAGRNLVCFGKRNERRAREKLPDVTRRRMQIERGKVTWRGRVLTRSFLEDNVTVGML